MSYIPPAEFGPFIKHFLESKRASKRSLEKDTGITRKTLDRWMGGDAEWIQYGTIGKFAEYFHLTLDDFFEEFEAYKRNTASDATQTPPCPLGNNEAVTLVQRNSTEATVPTRTMWGLVHKVATGIAIVALLMLAHFALFTIQRIQSATAASIPISGKVSCIDNEPVEGIWVDAVDDDHGWAIWYNINSNGSEAAFNYVLRYGDAYNLHIGCGGSKLHWKHSNSTENGSGTIQDQKSHFFTCKDPPSGVENGSCLSV